MVKKSDLPGLFWALAMVVFVVGLVYKPGVVFQGATYGLKAWWEVVFPALMPFFVVSEMLMRLGVVRFAGVLLEPIMRPVFNVPGTGGVVMVMGLTSGAPINALLTAQLRQRGLCTKVEAERLISFTNNCSPLFMLTAVAVGMFHKPQLGIVIAGSHYLANILLGICLRFYRRNEIEVSSKVINKGLFKRAVYELLHHQRQEKLDFSKQLAEAVSSSANKLIAVGGFIILFAVIIELFNATGITNVIASCFDIVLIPLGFTPEAITALANGVFETTIGTKVASEAMATELQRLTIIGMMLGWSGLAIIAQVASMVAGTGINLKIYLVSRIFHALIASFFTFLFYKPLTDAAPATTVFAPAIPFMHQPVMVISLGLVLVMFILLILLIFLSLIFQTTTSVLQLVCRIR